MENDSRKETEISDIKKQILYAAPVEACRLMKSDMRGLSREEAEKRLKQYGKNELEQKKHPELAVEPAGIYYYHIDDPYLKTDTLEAAADPELRLGELRLNGLSRQEEEVVGLLDHTVGPGETSNVISVGRNRDGSISKRSRAAGKETFEVIQRYADRKIRELGRRILDGAAEVSPAVLKKTDSCTYCPYHGICGFDERIPGYVRRRIKELPEEELLQRMAETDAEGRKEVPEEWQ